MNCGMPTLTPVPREQAVFDFDAPPAARWRAFVEHADSARDMRDFVKAAREASLENLGFLAETKLNAAAALLYCGAYSHFGHYVEESDALANQLAMDGVGRPVMAFLQRVYSLAHLGCTAAAVPVGRRGDGMRLVRSMDWEKPATEMGRVTRILDHREGGQLIYRTVGALGMCGHLSAVKAGVGAVTINWAATTEGAGFFMDPTLRLREVMESRGTRDFVSLVKALKAKSLAAPVFFTVCGPKWGQAAVLEYSGPQSREWRERPVQSDDEALVQSNHFIASEWLVRDDPRPGLNPEDAAGLKLEESSWARKARMEEQIAALSPMERLDPQTLFTHVLSEMPVLNKYSRQQMVLNPVDGTVVAWAHRS